MGSKDKTTVTVSVDGGKTYHDVNSPEARQGIARTIAGAHGIPDDVADAVSLKGGGSNSQAVIAGYITELVKAEDELERVSEPIKAHIKDIKAAAKAAKVRMKALTNAVKFKRADQKKREAMQEETSDTDLYLTFIQLSLFS